MIDPIRALSPLRLPLIVENKSHIGRQTKGQKSERQKEGPIYYSVLDEIYIYIVYMGII